MASQNCFSIQQVGNLIQPIVTRTLTGTLCGETLLIKSQLTKQLRVVQLLLYILCEMLCS